MPKKYEGLDGTELAISESQERMACVVAAEDKYLIHELAADENLQCVQVATVTEEPRLVMNWNGNKIVDISREFLNSNGADKHIDIEIEPQDWQKTPSRLNTLQRMQEKPALPGFMRRSQQISTCAPRGDSPRDSTPPLDAERC